MKRKKGKTLPQLKKTAWKLLSEIVRRSAASDIDGYVPCFTCGQRHPWKEIHAAHAIPGRTGATLLDEEIIRPGCYRCNVALGGNYPVFTTKLIREKAANSKGQWHTPEQIALDWWEAKLAASRNVHKWNRIELEEKINSYKARLNGL